MNNKILLLAAAFAVGSVISLADEPKIPTKSEILKAADAKKASAAKEIEQQIKDIKSGKARVPVAQRNGKIAELKKKLEDAKRFEPSPPLISLKVGSFGMFDSNVISFRVSRVIDKESALLEASIYQPHYKNVGNQQVYSGRTLSSNRAILLRGVDTSGLVDDEGFTPPTLCAFTRTEAIDGSKVLVLEPLKD